MYISVTQSRLNGKARSHDPVVVDSFGRAQAWLFTR